MFFFFCFGSSSSELLIEGLFCHFFGVVIAVVNDNDVAGHGTIATAVSIIIVGVIVLLTVVVDIAGDDNIVNGHSRGWALLETFRTVILGGVICQPGGVRGDLIVSGLGEDWVMWEDPGEGAGGFTLSNCFLTSRSFSNFSLLGRAHLPVVVVFVTYVGGDSKLLVSAWGNF